MTDLDHVSHWIEGYLRAWESNDPQDIARLFTSDADYYPAPFLPPWHGSDAIVAGWLDHRDEPGETTFAWEPLSLTADDAIITGRTTYPDTAYRNLWVIALAADGRSREFTEWWMEEPAPS
jgi:hypothetical protein